MTARAILVTITASHYCEKARWALERAGIDFEERGYLPGFHRVATGQGPKTTVPLLLAPTRLQESADIVAWADTDLREEARLYPKELRSEIDALEKSFDSVLGPAARCWAYGHLLADRKAFRRVMLPPGASPIQRVAIPGLMVLLRRVLNVNARTVARSEDTIRATFADVDRRLRDGRPFLFGDRWTAADLAFAALAGPVIQPTRYGGDRVGDLASNFPISARNLRDELRPRPAGQLVLQSYALFRDQPSTGAT